MHLFAGDAASEHARHGICPCLVHLLDQPLCTACVHDTGHSSAKHIYHTYDCASKYSTVQNIGSRFGPAGQMNSTSNQSITIGSLGEEDAAEPAISGNVTNVRKEHAASASERKKTGSMGKTDAADHGSGESSAVGVGGISDGELLRADVNKYRVRKLKRVLQERGQKCIGMWLLLSMIKKLTACAFPFQAARRSRSM